MSSRPPRIAFLIRDLDLGGAERQLAALTGQLAVLGAQVSVVPLYAGGALESELVAHGADVRPLGKRGRWDVVGPGRRLWRTLKALDPDVVHGYMTTANLAAYATRRLRARPRVVFGVRGAWEDWRGYDAVVRATTAIERRLARRVDLVIANSEAGADRMVRAGVPRARVHAVPNGVDTDLFRPDAARRSRARVDLGLTDDELAVGLVARLDPVKGVDVFVRAAAVLRDSDPHLRFFVIGDTRDHGYAAELRALADALHVADRLTWLGERDDMADVYVALDVVVSASHSEGMPNVVLEAMASAVPCVVTDVGDSATLVGDAGVVVPPNDVAALAASVALLASEIRAGASRGAQARSRVQEHYSVRRMATVTLALLADLCAASPA